jgi:amidase
MQDFEILDATAQAQLLRRGELTALELVEAAVERVEQLNPEVNAIVTPMYEQALQQARGKLPEGPLSGVPYVLKDLHAQVAGVRYTEGSRFLADFVSEHDQELVLRHRRAGLIAIGKSSTPEFGILPTTEPELFGPTRNPWNPAHSVGGSSGGSAAAVASGMVPLAHASDGGGSIRIPASCCALFGLKPTRMRNPTGPALGDGLAGFAVEHGLTRSVRDSAALLDATAGPDPGAPYYAAPPLRPFSQEVGVEPGRLRIGVTTSAVTGVPVDAECVRAVEDTALLCEELGHEVFPFTPSDLDGGEMSAAFIVLYTTAVAALIESWSRRLGRAAAPEHFEPLTWAMREAALNYPASDYMLALGELQRVSRRIAAYYADFDVWLMPVAAEPPPPLGTFAGPPDNPILPLMRAAMYVPFTPIANVTGQPAMSVPLSWTEAGLPVGSQFVGRYADEATLFRLASQLEEARPWAGRRPPLSVEAVS